MNQARHVSQPMGIAEFLQLYEKCCGTTLPAPLPGSDNFVQGIKQSLQLT